MNGMQCFKVKNEMTDLEKMKQKMKEMKRSKRTTINP